MFRRKRWVSASSRYINNGFFASIPIVSSAMGLAVGVALRFKKEKNQKIYVLYLLVMDLAKREFFMKHINFLHEVKKNPIINNL